MGNFFIDNYRRYVQFILSIAFLGHGLVSLGFSPSQALHLRLIDGVNFTGIDSMTILKIAGCFDLIMAFLVMVFYKKWIYIIGIVYVMIVSVTAMRLYELNTGSFFGFAEFARRLAWMLLLLFLLRNVMGTADFRLIRYSSAVAFLAHGSASLGFFGMRQAHIELASQVIPDSMVKNFIFCTGVSDTVIGLILLTGYKSQLVAGIGSAWILAVVVLSAMIAFPDGLFRFGFFLTCLYVSFDKRCSANPVIL
jgi:hypothetical protein